MKNVYLTKAPLNVTNKKYKTRRQKYLRLLDKKAIP